MSQVRFRDLLDDNLHKMSQLKAQLRDLQIEENRRVREEASERWKKKMQERAIQKESKTKRKSLNNDEEEAKLLTESTKKREDYLKKEKSLMEEIYHLQIKYSMTPLGRDRFHRRYWVFKSLPGLFIEDDSSYDINPVPKSSPKKDNKNFGKENLPKLDFSSKQNEYNFVETKWGFYHTTESLDQLLENLSERGIRESELKQILTDFKSRIIEHVEKSNYLINSLTMSAEDIETSLKNCLKENVSNVLANSLIQNNIPKKRGPKSKEMKELMVYLSDSSSQLSNSYSSISSHEYMENDLKEKLLELEEQIMIGGLGHLKVETRPKWRESILLGHYEPFCENLVWGELSRSAKEVTNFSSLKFTDLLSSSYQEPYSSEIQINIVNNFAKIMLQIEQSVDKKYLRTPLGDIHKTPERKKKNDDQRHGILSIWEKSLMLCTTLSQLFIHLQNLDESIAWSKSTLNAKCKICRKKGDPEHMVLCCKCDRGYHLYCLRPSLSEKPNGDWHCSDCRPKTIEKTPRKIRKSFNDEFYSDENSQNDDEIKIKKKKHQDFDDNQEMEDEETENEHRKRRSKSKSKVVHDESVDDEVEKKTRSRKRKLIDDSEEDKKQSKSVMSASTTSTNSNGSSVENGPRKLGRSRSAKSIYCELSDEFSLNGTDEESNHNKRKRAKTHELCKY